MNCLNLQHSHRMLYILLLLFALLESKPQAGCPVSEKCPYYSAHKGEHAGEKGCPLDKGGCPYYKKHDKDHSAEDIIAADSAEACPMEKCPYFEVRRFI
jgi:hypothetical protein